MEIIYVDIKMENRSLASNCLEVFVSWDMTPCRLIKKYRYFRSILVSHIQRVEEEGHSRSNSLFEYFTVFCSRDLLYSASFNISEKEYSCHKWGREEGGNPTFNKTDSIQNNLSNKSNSVHNFV